MSELIEILIENYDDEEKKFVLGKQVIRKVSMDELKQILIDLPCEDYSLAPRLITSNYIFSKEKEIWQKHKKVSYNYNLNISTIHLSRMYKRPISVERLERLMTSSPRSLKIERIIDISFGLFIVSASFLFTIFFFDVNSPIMYNIILVWMDFLSLFYMIHTITQTKTRIQIKFTYPFQNYFKPYDITNSILFFSVYEVSCILLLLSPWIFEELNIFPIFILLIPLVIMGLLWLWIIITFYYRKKKEKESRLGELYILVRSLEQDQQQFFYLFAVKAEEQKIVSGKTLYKFLGSFSLILSIFPLFSLL